MLNGGCPAITDVLKSVLTSGLRKAAEREWAWEWEFTVRGDLVRKLVVRCLTAGLAVLAFFAFALTSVEWLGLALTVGTVASALVERRVRPNTDLVAESVLLGTGILVGYARQLPGGADWPLVVTAATLLGLILIERPLRLAGALDIRTVHLEVRASPWQAITASLPTVILALLTGLAACAALALSPWPAMVVTLSTGALYAAAVALAAKQRLRPPAGHDPVTTALRRHQPEFVLYFTAPPRSEYQVLMWLPYLERIGRPFIVVIREAEHMAAVSAATNAPVVLCPALHNLDDVLVPTIRVAFYVNHGAKNAHCVRFTNITHIQLHHGDSDKAPSATPASAVFDKIFVAGQAAIDRYARNGVSIPREKFAIVGRPQVESIVVSRDPVRDRAEKVVLYTPTWTGHFADVNYCSLPVGEILVKRLLARGVTVILRSHPYTSQSPTSVRLLARIEQLLAEDRASTGRRHIFGTEAARKMSLVECANRSHALVSDVSGVISDYLYSSKPYAVTDRVNEGERFTQSFPLARSGYVLRADMSNADEVLDQLLETDPLEDARWKTRTEYLSDFPAEEYADGFLGEARRQLGAPTATLPAPRPAPVP